MTVLALSNTVLRIGTRGWVILLSKGRIKQNDMDMYSIEYERKMYTHSREIHTDNKTCP